MDCSLVVVCDGTLHLSPETLSHARYCAIWPIDAPFLNKGELNTIWDLV